MSWQEDHARLAAAFTDRGIIGRDLQHLQEVESGVARKSVPWLRGTNLVSDCFQALVVQSYRADRPLTKIVNLPQLAIFLAAFRTLRFTYNVFWQGYYLEAYGSLRSVLENIYVLGAYAKGRVSHSDLTLDEESRRRAVHAIAGKHSKLSVEDQAELKGLKDLLAIQLHGSRLVSGSIILDAVSRKRVPSVEPYFDEREIQHYAQISACLMWPFLRVWKTLPDRPTDASWNEKYDLLEGALRSSVVATQSSLAQAIERWVDTELDFRDVPLRVPVGSAEGAQQEP